MDNIPGYEEDDWYVSEIVLNIHVYIYLFMWHVLNIRLYFISVIQVFRSQRDIQVPKSKANNITWIRVEVYFQNFDYISDDTW